MVEGCNQFLIRLSSKEISNRESIVVANMLHALGDMERISDYSLNLISVAKKVNKSTIEIRNEIWSLVSPLIEFDKGSAAGSSDISGASLSGDSTDVLKDYAKKTAASGGSLDAKLIVTPQSESAVEKGVVSDIKSQGESIFSGLDVPISSVKFDFLDMSIYTSNDKFTSDNIKREGAELNNPLHIVVDYNLSGKHNPVVIRSHAGSSEAFNKLSSLPSAGEYKDATYYVGDNTIHIFTSQFSTYSIAYSTSPVNRLPAPPNPRSRGRVPAVPEAH